MNRAVVVALALLLVGAVAGVTTADDSGEWAGPSEHPDGGALGPVDSDGNDDGGMYVPSLHPDGGALGPHDAESGSGESE